MKKTKASQFFANNSQLLIPLIAILLLVIFNLIRDPSFFSVGITTNNNGDPVLHEKRYIVFIAAEIILFFEKSFCLGIVQMARHNIPGELSS